jgi:hypothetical protein
MFSPLLLFVYLCNAAPPATSVVVKVPSLRGKTVVHASFSPAGTVSAVVTAQGQGFMWGSNEFHELGIGMSFVYFAPS